jgi:hypothetical protein
MDSKLLNLDLFEFEIECLPEDLPVRGNASFIDEETDRAIEDRIIADLERGNEWAWCTVKVTARLIGCEWLEGESSLGCCSYASEEDFIKNSGCLDDLKREAVKDCRAAAGLIYARYVRLVELGLINCW